MTETAEARLKRMRMRSWRRGTKEMDLILGPWADERLETLDAATLALYDQMLEENDQDLYLWASGAQQSPAIYADLLTTITDFAASRHLNVRR